MRRGAVKYLGSVIYVFRGSECEFYIPRGRDSHVRLVVVRCRRHLRDQSLVEPCGPSNVALVQLWLKMRDEPGI